MRKTEEKNSILKAKKHLL